MTSEISSENSPNKKDVVVKQLLYDYNFTMGGISQLYHNNDDFIERCDLITYEVINRIKKIYNITDIN